MDRRSFVSMVAAGAASTLFHGEAAVAQGIVHRYENLPVIAAVVAAQPDRAREVLRDIRAGIDIVGKPIQSDGERQIVAPGAQGQLPGVSLVGEGLRFLQHGRHEPDAE